MDWIWLLFAHTTHNFITLFQFSTCYHLLSLHEHCVSSAENSRDRANTHSKRMLNIVVESSKHTFYSMKLKIAAKWSAAYTHTFITRSSFAVKNAGSHITCYIYGKIDKWINWTLSILRPYPTTLLCIHSIGIFCCWMLPMRQRMGRDRKV